MAGDHADGPWNMTDPRCDRAVIPYTDAETEALVDELVDTLIILRCRMGLGDAGPTISVLASLEAELAFRLLDAVADARDQGYTWNEIATRLATTASAARHRSRHELRREPSSLATSETRVSDDEPTIARRETPVRQRSCSAGG